MTASASARPHGEARYNHDGCRCEVCREAVRVGEARRRRARAYGRSSFVDAAPVRAHVGRLRASGLGVERIAMLAEVSPGVVKKLLYGDPARGTAPSRRVRRASATAIMSIKPDLDQLGAGALVDATGTRRRLQALVALGWPQSELARRIGSRESTVGDVLDASRTSVGVFRKVCAVFDELWDKQPPASGRWERAAVTHARRRAARRGWAPPLAWDDDTIDDPDAEPQHAVTGDGPPNRRIHFEDVEFLLATGSTIEAIAERLGAKPATIERYAGVIAAGAQDSWRTPADDAVSGAA